MSFITRAAGAVKLASKAHAPTIMVISGVTSMGAAAVLGAKQTLKVESVLAKHVPDLDKVNQGRALGLEGYTEKDARNDRIKVYTRVSVDMCKLYGVPTILFVGGAALVFGGHRVMLKRNATLAIAFTSIQKAFDTYRARVIEQEGPAADHKYMHGYKLTEVVDPETNQVETIHTRDWDDNTDPYNRLFAEGTAREWQDDIYVNRMFLDQQRRSAQQLLNLRGHLYLSEVYEALGIPETGISRLVGWKTTRDADGNLHIPTVDFGLDKPMPDDWKYGRNNEIYLDFNCQGLIVGGKVQKIIENA